jgi:hypothetical protein
VGEAAEFLHGSFIDLDIANCRRGIDNRKLCRQALFQKAAQAPFRQRETWCFESGRLQGKSEAPPLKKTVLLKGVL